MASQALSRGRLFAVVVLSSLLSVVHGGSRLQKISVESESSSDLLSSTAARHYIDKKWISDSCILGGIPPPSVLPDRDSTETRTVAEIVTHYVNQRPVVFPSRLHVHNTSGALRARLVQSAAEELAESLPNGAQLAWYDRAGTDDLVTGLLDGSSSDQGASLVFTDSYNLVWKILADEKLQHTPVVYYQSVLDTEQLAKGFEMYRAFYYDAPQSVSVVSRAYNFHAARAWVRAEVEAAGVTKGLDAGAAVARHLRFIVVTTTSFSFGKFKEGMKQLRDALIIEGRKQQSVFVNRPQEFKSNCFVSQWMHHLMSEETHRRHRPIAFLDFKQVEGAVAKNVRHFVILDDNSCTGTQMKGFLFNLVNERCSSCLSPPKKDAHYKVSVGILFGTRVAAEVVVAQMRELCHPGSSVDVVEKQSPEIDLVIQVQCRTRKFPLTQTTKMMRRVKPWRLTFQVVVYRLIVPLLLKYTSADGRRKEAAQVFEALQFMDLNRDMNHVSCRFDWKCVDKVSMSERILFGGGMETDDGENQANRWLAPSCPPYKMMMANRFAKLALNPLLPKGALASEAKDAQMTLDEYKMRLFCDTVRENRHGNSFAFPELLIGTFTYWSRIPVWKEFVRADPGASTPKAGGSLPTYYRPNAPLHTRTLSCDKEPSSMMVFPQPSSGRLGSVCVEEPLTENDTDSVDTGSVIVKDPLTENDTDSVKIVSVKEEP